VPPPPPSLPPPSRGALPPPPHPSTTARSTAPAPASRSWLATHYRVSRADRVTPVAGRPMDQLRWHDWPSWLTGFPSRGSSARRRGWVHMRPRERHTMVQSQSLGLGLDPRSGEPMYRQIFDQVAARIRT